MFDRDQRSGVTLLKYLMAIALGNGSGRKTLCTAGIVPLRRGMVGTMSTTPQGSCREHVLTVYGGIIVHFVDSEIPRWRHFTLRLKLWWGT